MRGAEPAGGAEAMVMRVAVVSMSMPRAVGVTMTVRAGGLRLSTRSFVRMRVQCPLGMRMRRIVDGRAVDPCLAVTAAAGCAHGSSFCQLAPDALLRQSRNLDFPYPHVLAGDDLDLIAAAARTGLAECRDGNARAARHAPRFTGRRDDVEPRFSRRAAARHRVEAEAKRLRLDVRQRAQLEADRRDTRRTVRPRGVLDDLEHAFGERHLMHAQPRLQRRRRDRAPARRAARVA